MPHQPWHPWHTRVLSSIPNVMCVCAYVFECVRECVRTCVSNSRGAEREATAPDEIGLHQHDMIDQSNTGSMIWIPLCQQWRLATQQSSRNISWNKMKVFAAFPHTHTCTYIHLTAICAELFIPILHIFFPIPAQSDSAVSSVHHRHGWSTIPDIAHTNLSQSHTSSLSNYVSLCVCFI